MVRYGLRPLRAFLPGTGARIVALVGGLCTKGPGSIVFKDLSARFVHVKIWTRMQHHILGRQFSFIRNLQSR
ncbi:hypothetical protein L1987_78055 [Smallanthus sonchifolius]|uniref:Uncharacterized protein n=1 Tax=Smallanthus sonchifolius TaxID=185202 RepID=A0ACB8ZBU1_9ASTR|nr:hypothetical protein L1987_78055 [Smallanthus sonchifolius]